MSFCISIYDFNIATLETETLQYFLRGQAIYQVRLGIIQKNGYLKSNFKSNFRMKIGWGTVYTPILALQPYVPRGKGRSISNVQINGNNMKESKRNVRNL